MPIGQYITRYYCFSVLLIQSDLHGLVEESEEACQQRHPIHQLSLSPPSSLLSFLPLSHQQQDQAYW